MGKLAGSLIDKETLKMRLRSSGKHEPFLILNDDRKTARNWDEDPYEHAESLVTKQIDE